MQQSASIQEHPPADHDQTTPTAGNTTGAPRLRTVTGVRFLTRCACGCSQPIPRDPALKVVVDFGAAKPYPTYLREHSPDFGTYRGGARPARARADAGAPPLPGFVPASALLPKPAGPENGSPSLPSTPPTADPAHSEADASPSPQAGRPWASGSLVFNCGSFESARSAYADYGRENETGEQLRARVNRVIVQDLELKILALRALHEKLRDATAGPSLGDVVARGRPG